MQKMQKQKDQVIAQLKRDLARAGSTGGSSGGGGSYSGAGGSGNYGGGNIGGDSASKRHRNRGRWG